MGQSGAQGGGREGSPSPEKYRHASIYLCHGASSAGLRIAEAASDLHAALRVALRGRILRLPPPSAPFGSALSRLGISASGTELLQGFAPTIPSSRNLLSPEGVHPTEEFFQAGEG